MSDAGVVTRFNVALGELAEIVHGPRRLRDSAELMAGRGTASISSMSLVRSGRTEVTGSSVSAPMR